MPEHLTIATANTQMSKMIRQPGGLKPLAEADAILLQEVMVDESELAGRLDEEVDMVLGVFDEEFGLAIAANPKYSFSKPRIETLQARGLVGRRLDIAKFRLRARGLIALTLETPGSNKLIVATTHPTVQLKARSRARQVREIPIVLTTVTDPLVLGGDMNHWPGPRAVDRQMYERAGLTAVDIPEDSTFDVSRTRYSWLGKLARAGIPINAKLDAMLYRGEGLSPVETELVDVPSDHRAVVTTFNLGE